MQNKTLSKLFAALITTIMSLSFSSAAWAQAATCGITGSATAGTAYYDPFNPAGLAATTIILNLKRANPPGGAKTDIVNFYLQAQNATSDGTSIVPTNVAIVGAVDGLNRNIFYNFSSQPPIVAPTSQAPSAANRFLKLEFTGENTASDTAAVTFQVTLPPNLNLSAGNNLAFDAVFACSTTGGGPKTQQTGRISNAVVFPVVVLSALQARYGGEALNFGEVGDKTTADIGGSTYTKTGTIYVRSSGAYEIRMTSDNDYRLAFSNAGAAIPGTSMTYRATLVGESRSGVSGAANNVQTPITKICSQAGLIEKALPLTVVLTEGGNSKTPAPVYNDFLNVTVTPQIASVLGSACP